MDGTRVTKTAEIRERFSRGVRVAIEHGDMRPFLQETVLLTQGMFNAYADLSGDENPIHIDKEVAKQRGFLNTVAPGLLVVALIPRLDPLFRALVIESGLTILDRKPSIEFHQVVLCGTSLCARRQIIARDVNDTVVLKIRHEIHTTAPNLVAEVSRTLVCSLPEFA